MPPHSYCQQAPPLHLHNEQHALVKVEGWHPATRRLSLTPHASMTKFRHRVCTLTIPNNNTKQQPVFDSLPTSWQIPHTNQTPIPLAR